MKWSGDVVAGPFLPNFKVHTYFSTQRSYPNEESGPSAFFFLNLISCVFSPVNEDTVAYIVPTFSCFLPNHIAFFPVRLSDTSDHIFFISTMFFFCQVKKGCPTPHCTQNKRKGSDYKQRVRSSPLEAKYVHSW